MLNTATTVKTTTDNLFNIPSHLLGHVQSFIRELCQQSIESGDGPIYLHVRKFSASPKDGKRAEGRLIGTFGLSSAPAYRQAEGLCRAAEGGIFSIPEGINEESRPVGKLGHTITLDVHLYSIYSFQGKFGHTHAHRFHDALGNELVWQTTSRKFDAGHYSLVGRVKEHRVSRSGVMETVLTWCRLSRKE